MWGEEEQEQQYASEEKQEQIELAKGRMCIVDMVQIGLEVNIMNPLASHQ